MNRQPRKLQFYKCTQCRKDRQKCTPVDRDWPTQRCDRCNKFGYSCSESMTAGGTLRRDPSISHGKQPAQPNVSGAEPLHGLSFPKSTSTNEIAQVLASFVPGKEPIGSQSKPKCADLFRNLNTGYWAYQSGLMSPVTDSESASSEVLRKIEGMMLETNALQLYGLLHYREGLVSATKKLEKEVVAYVTKGDTRNGAVKLAIAKLFQARHHENEDESEKDHIVGLSHTFREGNRWQRLIDAVGSPEILLIGCTEDEYYSDSDEEDSSGELENVQALIERFRKNPKSVNIDGICKAGSDDVFAKMEELLLAPDLQLKETCHRLSGLSHMINRFKDSNKRVIFPLGFDTEHNGDSNLSSFLASEIHRRLKEVFGEAQPEETKSTDSCEPEATSDVIESDEEWGLDEDFCINLSKSKAFESASWI